MKHKLSEHHKRHLRKLGLVDVPDSIEASPADYNYHYSAWQRTLPRASEETLHTKTLANLAWVKNSGIPGSLGAQPHIIEDAKNARINDIANHLHEIRHVHHPEAESAKQVRHEELVAALGGVESAIDASTELTRAYSAEVNVRFESLFASFQTEAEKTRASERLAELRRAALTNRLIKTVRNIGTAILVFLGLIFLATICGQFAHAQFSKINSIQWQSGGSNISGGFIASSFTINFTGAGCTPSFASQVITVNCSAGSGSSTTGTGFWHNTTGSLDAAARAVDVSSADVTGTLAAARFGALTGDVTSAGATYATTVAKVNGVAFTASPSTDTIPIITASNTATYTSVPDCQDATGNHLNYTASTHTISCGTSATSQLFFVTSDFTTAANTNLQNITGLTWVLAASTAQNADFYCDLIFQQATAVVADSWGISASVAPTQINASGFAMKATAQPPMPGTLVGLNTTTATAIVTGTPGAINTNETVHLTGLIENPSTTASTITIMAKTSTAADVITVKRGSYCKATFR